MDVVVLYTNIDPLVILSISTLARSPICKVFAAIIFPESPLGPGIVTATTIFFYWTINSCLKYSLSCHRR